MVPGSLRPLVARRRAATGASPTRGGDSREGLGGADGRVCIARSGTWGGMVAGHRPGGRPVAPDGSPSGAASTRSERSSPHPTAVGRRGLVVRDGGVSRWLVDGLACYPRAPGSRLSISNLDGLDSRFSISALDGLDSRLSISNLDGFDARSRFSFHSSLGSTQVVLAVASMEAK